MNADAVTLHDSIARQLRGKLERSGVHLLPTSVRVSQETDAQGVEAWRVLLGIPAPEGATWDREDVFQLRRSAIRFLDRIVASDSLDLPGRTIATVTSDGPAEVAEEEMPSPGEDPRISQ